MGCCVIYDLFNTLKYYQTVTGAIFNPKKSNSLWLGRNQGRLDTTLNLTRSSDRINILVVEFTNAFDAKEFWNSILEMMLLRINPNTITSVLTIFYKDFVVHSEKSPLRPKGSLKQMLSQSIVYECVASFMSCKHVNKYLEISIRPQNLSNIKACILFEWREAIQNTSCPVRPIKTQIYTHNSKEIATTSDVVNHPPKVLLSTCTTTLPLPQVPLRVLEPLE